MRPRKPLVAYFSLEIAVAPEIPSYAGGLGVLAGDTLRAAADLSVPMVGVTLLYRKGYFEQVLDAEGRQTARDVAWLPEAHLERLAASVEVELAGRRVVLGLWRRLIEGVGAEPVPVIFLDADREENAAEDRRLTDQLYGGDEGYRLAQEVLLGIGGRRALAALGLRPHKFHMNEGHASLLALDLLRDEVAAGAELTRAAGAVQERCVFTTHTPIPAGHDRFPRALATTLLGRPLVDLHARLTGQRGELNMSALGAALSGFVNAVSRRHAEVSRAMFPGRSVEAVTNGVHSATWTAPPLQRVLDRHVPQWRREAWALRLAQAIPAEEIAAAHAESKRALVEEVNRHGEHDFAEERFTIGLARRATSYKRLTLLLREPRRLRELAGRWGALQVVVAGKAHPRDEDGQRTIAAIVGMSGALLPFVRVAFLPGYDLTLSGLLTAGADLWLNTPRAPLEASGTSGMKAAHNGVPNLSVRDGWWCEGFIEGQTGWVIEPTGSDEQEAEQLYRALDEEILPLHRGDPGGWAERMRACVALAASYFNTHRMLGEYCARAYGM